MRRHVGDEALGGFDVDGQRAQVPIVDANHLGTDSDRSRQLQIVVHFNERIEPETPRRGQQPMQLFVGQRGHDQQHGISAGRTRFQQLIFRDHEIFSQKRCGHRGSNGTQMFERAVEECRLRQH